MKVTFITIVSFFVVLLGCSSEEKLLLDHNTEIVQASYKHWSEAPPVQSDVRERGTDLEIVVKNWPEELEPKHVIYRKIESFPVEVTDSTEAGLTMKARIIRSSAVISETSNRVELSDRLVFTDSDGKTGFMEIKKWERMQK